VFRHGMPCASFYCVRAGPGTQCSSRMKSGAHASGAANLITRVSRADRSSRRRRLNNTQPQLLYPGAPFAGGKIGITLTFRPPR
jgi:hypothetical protein